MWWLLKVCNRFIPYNINLFQLSSCQDTIDEYPSLNRENAAAIFTPTCLMQNLWKSSIRGMITVSTETKVLVVRTWYWSVSLVHSILLCCTSADYMSSINRATSNFNSSACPITRVFLNFCSTIIINVIINNIKNLQFK